MAWLILVHRIPSKPLYLRAKMRQRLAAVGAIAVKNAVYVLPQNAETLEDMQWIAQEIVSGGGDAHLFTGDFVDGEAKEAAIRQFRQERDADYEAVQSEARAALREMRSAATASALAATHARLHRRLEEIREVDFFEAGGRTAAQQALSEIEKRMAKDRKEETRVVKANRELIGKTWVTRPGVKVDRIASAWFVRRFIDPKAKFRFADPASERRQGEIRFDMVGGDFTHEKDQCTLETLIKRVGLPDKGVRAIAEIVHDLDLKDRKYGRAETSGVAAMLEGLFNRTDADHERIERGLLLFDDLHSALGKASRRKS